MNKKYALIFLFGLDVMLLVCLMNRQNPKIYQTFSGKIVKTCETMQEEKPNTKTNNMQEFQKIALTFDDGPHPKYTEQLLDGLKERGVKATFFVTGEHAELHPDVIRRMQEEGHLIGNHTYSHIQLTSKNEKEFIEELKQTNLVLKEITGEETEFVRPPYGCWNKQVEEELNMFPVLWTIDPEDWNRRNASAIAKSVIRKAGEDDIILMHDYYSSSVEAALLIVDKLLEDGYTFVTVEELLLD